MDNDRECPKSARHCEDALFYEYMKQNCKKTCGHCELRSFSSFNYAAFKAKLQLPFVAFLPLKLLAKQIKVVVRMFYKVV